jgi:uncharacterized protein (TIGR02231 family)
MLYKVALSVFLSLTTLFAFGVEEKVVNNKIREVTVFFKGAQVFRAGDVTVEKGTTKIVFSGVSPLINPKSLQASSSGSVDILDVKHRVVHPDPNNIVDEELPSGVLKSILKYTDSLSRQQFRVQRLNADYQNLVNEKTLLLQSNLMANNSRDTLPELKTAMDFYRSKLLNIDNRIEKSQWKVYLAKKKEGVIQGKLTDFRNYHKLNGKKLKPIKIIHEVIITVDAPANMTTKVELNYLVSNAGWIPGYDLRADKANKHVDLTYKASVYQDTDEDWSNVKLSLSTFNYDISGALPVLKTKNINIKQVKDYGKKPKKKSKQMQEAWNTSLLNTSAYVVCSGASDGSVSINATGGSAGFKYNLGGNWDAGTGQYTYVTLDQNTAQPISYNISMPDLRSRQIEVFTPKIVPEYRFVGESYINTKFEIKRKYDIKSDANETIVIIREAKVTADFSHYLVPKEDNNAFLVTKISDWEELNLLKANANIYMNSTYIGETGVDPSLISDTMQLSLGRDHGLYCVRKKINDESKESAFSKMIEHTEEFEITIKNTNAHTLKIYIKDQIPVTNNEDIEITLLNSSKGELDSETGELLWEVELKPKAVKTLKFGYTVRYDKEKTLAAHP